MTDLMDDEQYSFTISANSHLRLRELVEKYLTGLEGQTFNDQAKIYVQFRIDNYPDEY